MKVKRDPIQRKLEVRRGGGCVGAIGSAFAFWFAVFGSTLIIGWRAGDFSTGEFLGFGILIGAFFLCGLGLATYRERFCFDARRRVMIQSRQVLFITYKKQQWSIHNFVAVELSWYRRDVNNKNVWSHVIRLLPAQVDGAHPEPLELGTGKVGKETLALAQEIADFSDLPLRTPPKGNR